MNITPEQIHTLHAGIEADRLTAEYVFGWKWYWWAAVDGIHTWRRLVSPDRAPHPSYRLWTLADGDIPIFNLELPAYSSDWSAMEQVVIQMRRQGWRWTLFCNEEEPWFVASFSKPERFIGGKAKESDAPLAAVKAALLALRAEQKPGNGGEE